MRCRPIVVRPMISRISVEPWSAVRLSNSFVRSFLSSSSRSRNSPATCCRHDRLRSVCSATSSGKKFPSLTPISPKSRMLSSLRAAPASTPPKSRIRYPSSLARTIPASARAPWPGSQCTSQMSRQRTWVGNTRGWTCRPAVKSLLRQALRSSRQEAMNPGVGRRRRLACIREGLADGQPADDNGRRGTQASVPDRGKGALRRRRRSEFSGAAAKCRWNSRQMCQDIAMLVERSQAVFSSDHVDP